MVERRHGFLPAPKDRRTGHRRLHSHVPDVVRFCSNRQTGAYSNNIGKNLRVWRQKTSLENKFPHGNGQNPIFWTRNASTTAWVFCHVRFPGINVYISGCFAILLVGFWYMLHESLVCPLTREQVLVMHLCGVQGFQRELSWIPKVNFRDFKVALPLSLHFREMFSGFTWMLVAEFVSKSIKVEGSISKEFG